MERCAERRGHRRVLMAARQHGASHQARRLRERHAAARGPDAEPAGHVHLPVAHGARVGATRGLHAHALTPRAGTAWNGALYLGDTWRAGGGVQVAYGARLEGARFDGAPAYNRAVDSLFG